MTLIVAVPASDGVVFGSDSQVTFGAVRSTTRKIFQLGDNAIWGASGELALIQRVAERLDGFGAANQPLVAIRDHLAVIVREVVQTLLNTDFRTQFVAQNPDALLNLHPGDFLFVEHRDRPRILHILTNGTSEWVEGRCSATGNGAIFAHALLQKYAGTVLDLEKAKLLAYKVIEEAIQVGSYGVGPPIDIWTVSADGVRRTDEIEQAGIEDAVRLLRGAEVGLLIGWDNDGDDEVRAIQEAPAEAVPVRVAPAAGGAEPRAPAPENG